MCEAVGGWEVGEVGAHAGNGGDGSLGEAPAGFSVWTARKFLLE